MTFLDLARKCSVEKLLRNLQFMDQLEWHVHSILCSILSNTVSVCVGHDGLWARFCIGALNVLRCRAKIARMPPSTTVVLGLPMIDLP